MLYRNSWSIGVALWLLAAANADAQVRVARLPTIDSVPPVATSSLDQQLQELTAEVRQQAGEIQQLRNQLSADEAAWFPEQDLQGFQGRWNYGLWFESPGGDFRANIGGRVEQDSVWSSTEPDVEADLGRMEDGTFFRRARIHGAGTMYGVIDLFAEFEAAPVDNLVFQDMWAQLRDVPWLGHIRVGHVKVPFGLENVTSAKYITFMERSAVHDAFQQEYDPGIMFWNYGPQKDVAWAAALMRLDPNESGIAFGNGRYSGVGRVTMVPWSTQDDNVLFHVGGGYRYDNTGVFDPDLGVDVVRHRARPELRSTLRLVDTGPLAASAASYVLLESAVAWGSFSAQAEYVQSTVHDAAIPMGPALGDVTFDGYYLYVSYFLTGETRPYDRTQGVFARVVPFENVRPGTGRSMCRMGSWELTFRYSHVDLNDVGVTGGELQTVTSGLTWYLNPNTKMMFNHIWARRDVPGPGAEGEVNLFGLRFHIAF